MPQQVGAVASQASPPLPVVVVSRKIQLVQLKHLAALGASVAAGLAADHQSSD